MAKIEFFSLIPEIVKSMPIIPAKEHRYEWYSKALQKAKEDKVKINVARCPGIIELNTMGWIQRSYQDITIVVDNDKKLVSMESEIDQKTLGKWPAPVKSHFSIGDFIGDYLHEHPSSLLADYRNGHDFSMDSLIKINSPWRVIIPEGFSLLCFPIPYPDDQRFTAAHGILRNGINSLNPQLFYHGPYGTKQVIKKGTPLQQYILVEDTKVNCIVREYEMNDVDNQLKLDV